MRVEDKEAREYCLRECEAQNWSSRNLERNIYSFYRQRVRTNQSNQKVQLTTESIEGANIVFN